MGEARTVLGEQFVELPQQREAATLGMWVFLATEVLFFGALFLAYAVYRHTYPAAFLEAGPHTNLLCGSINTVVLLTSGLTMALAVQAARADKMKACFGLLLATVGLGLAFLAVKGVEYHIDIEEHLLPGAQFRTDLPPQAWIFWFLYWVMTGVHAVHMVVGIGLLGTMACLTRRGKFSGGYYTPIEISGLYWGFVDVIWNFLYPLLYLIHRYP